MKAVRARGLVKRFSGDVVALDGLDLAVDFGVVVALLGPNGAGKSTAVRILTTLTTPDEGVATVAGFDVRTQPELVRERVGIVAQRSGADPDATGRENLDLQGKLYGLSAAERKRWVAELLADFDLVAAADRLVRTYSGGMKRRLDLAMGIIHKPQVLIPDEPTTGVDPEGRAELWKAVERLVADENVAVLLTTHYLEEADRLADHVVLIDRGSVVAEGIPDDLKSQLHGDKLEVELAEKGQSADAARIVSRISGVGDVQIHDRAVHCSASRGAETLPVILHALARGGASVRAVTVSRPSLDDVYLKYTGRKLASPEQDVA